MGRAEAGTPKAIANKMKSKGLQKLRWYCQMCQKQCRDENGFKCHTMSESHQRQLLLFAENPHTYLDSFSEEFKSGFVDILKRQYGGKRVSANQVYQEYIRFKEHIHMNATKWLSLTGFVKWMGREGICTVDETEKGWFVAYIDKDSEAILAEQRKSKRAKLELDDEQRQQSFIQKQIDRLKQKDESASSKESEEKKEFKREDDEAKIALNISGVFLKPTNPIAKKASNPLMMSKAKIQGRKDSNTESSFKRSALDEIMIEEAKRKKDINDYWLTPGIVVKVVTKSAGEKYYKKKGIVKNVIDKYAALVKLPEENVTLKLDQVHCETVIPAVGRKVKIVNGAYCGQEATLEEIDVKKFCASLKLKTGVLVRSIDYEHFSKLST